MMAGAAERALRSAELLEGLFDARVRCAAASLDWTPEALLPEERSLVAKAVESRQREFSTGRILARRLLAEHGVHDFALLRDSDRVPSWPDGVTGSISHTHDLAVVALASSAEFEGVGLDVEPDEPVERGIERIVCRDAERAWLEAGPGGERGARCKIVFSTKEAVYKAFFPRTRVFWSFQDVEVEIDLTGERFEARLPESAGRPRIEGRIFRRQGWILSSVEVRGER
jgi:4'-phosphopantetheinyl transferase EntD